VAGGVLLIRFMRRIPLPSEGLYPLRALAGALVIYGPATLAHGSGFLAVFVAGILAGDAPAPYKGEIERFHGALASLAEIVAFVVLGLTIGLHTLPDRGALAIGLVLAVLIVVVRPLGVGLLLVPVRLAWGERLFVLWAGLKGAVPIPLAASCSPPGFPTRLGCMASSWSWWSSRSSSKAAWCPRWRPCWRCRCGPWSPNPGAGGALSPGAPRAAPTRRRPRFPADGPTIGELDVGEDVWISFVIRDD
jgi:potassium/hydrogen antiporter